MSLESMVRLQSVLSKPTGQSRRPHNPHSVLFLDSLSPLPELLCPSSSRIEVLPRLSVLKSYMSRGKKKAHILTFTYLLEMLDRRRSFSHSPTPPACHSLSSPHELLYEVNKAVNQSSFSIVLQIRAVRLNSCPMITMPSLPLLSARPDLLTSSLICLESTFILERSSALSSCN